MSTTYAGLAGMALASDINRPDARVVVLSPTSNIYQPLSITETLAYKAGNNVELKLRLASLALVQRLYQTTGTTTRYLKYTSHRATWHDHLQPSSEVTHHIMSSKPIFVATHPRACSTAFERVHPSSCSSHSSHTLLLTTSSLMANPRCRKLTRTRSS